MTDWAENFYSNRARAMRERADAHYAAKDALDSAQKVNVCDQMISEFSQNHPGLLPPMTLVDRRIIAAQMVGIIWALGE